MALNTLKRLVNIYIIKQLAQQLVLLGVRATLKLLLKMVDEMYDEFLNKYGDKISFKNEKEEAEFRQYFEQKWSLECQKMASRL